MKALFRQVVVGMVIPAMLGASSSALYTWRKVAIQNTEIANLKDKLVEEQKRIDDHQKDINDMYAIGGKLDELIGEVHELRADLRAKKDK
jgi:cell division protein FtsL